MAVQHEILTHSSSSASSSQLSNQEVSRPFSILTAFLHWKLDRTTGSLFTQTAHTFVKLNTYWGILWGKASCFIQPLSTSLSLSLCSLCVEQECVTFVDTCVHLCSCGPHFVLSLPGPPDAPAHPPGTISPFSAPLAGLRPLCLAWKTSQLLLFLLCRNELCDLLDLYLFLLLTGS